MVYSVIPARQRWYDRTDFKRGTYWKESARVRLARIRRAILIPAVLGVLTFFLTPGMDSFLRMESIMMAVMLPWLVLGPIAIITWKNDRAACRGYATRRFADRLELQPKRLLYSYQKQREGRHGMRYEALIPYSLLDRAIYYPDRDLLALWGGGIDTIYDQSGAALQHENYWIGFGEVRRCNRWIRLPMLYADNEKVLRELEELSGTPVERQPGPDLKIGPLPKDRNSGGQ